MKNEKDVLRKLQEMSNHHHEVLFNLKRYYITMIRPVGSACWTFQRIATSKEAAERQAAEERNQKIRFADGSMHLQSTAIVEVFLPEEPDRTQQHYESHETGCVTQGVA